MTVIRPGKGKRDTVFTRKSHIVVRRKGEKEDLGPKARRKLMETYVKPQRRLTISSRNMIEEPINCRVSTEGQEG